MTIISKIFSAVGDFASDIYHQTENDAIQKPFLECSDELKKFPSIYEWNQETQKNLGERPSAFTIMSALSEVDQKYTKKSISAHPFMKYAKNTEPETIKEHQTSVVLSLFRTALEADAPQQYLEKKPRLFQIHGADNENNKAIIKTLEWAQYTTSPKALSEITKLLMDTPILRQAMEWNAGHNQSHAFLNIIRAQCSEDQKLKLINTLDRDPNFLSTMFKEFSDFSKFDNLYVSLLHIDGKSKDSAHRVFERLQKTHFWKQWPDNEHKWNMAAQFDSTNPYPLLNDLGR